MQLKPYQRQALAALSDFLAAAQEGDPAAAFEAVLNAPAPDGQPTLRRRLGRYYRPYSAPAGLGDTPYVCLRLPTGGGKTILAAHSVKAVRDVGLGGDYPLVLWLVTSDIIRTQTAEALKDPRHPYRAALDEAFDGRVRVFDMADYAQIRPQDLAQNACIVVGTVQALKITDTNKRKVYAHHEDLEPHFSRISRADLDVLPGLERDPDGQVKFSFANLMHLRRPLMLIDEAHNVVTGLSDEMRRRINPSAVVEFTATPRGRSNILFNVSAAELKAEAMIKLPIVLQEHPHWQSAVFGAVQERSRLAALAARDRQYIRPLALYQAEPINREVTVAVLKRHLIDDLQIPEDRIAVATGGERGLDGIDLRSKDCSIEHIITVEALKEGWDAPFAYVFCSVASIRSATAVEQLLGRVLRMPYAERRADAELNKAYAHVSEPSFREAAEALKDTLIDMGFDDGELPDVIEHVTQTFDWDDNQLFGAREGGPAFVSAQDTPEIRAVLEQAGMAPQQTPEGDFVLRAADLARPGLADAITRAQPALATQVQAVVAAFSPSQRGQTFTIPRLVTRVQGELAYDLDEIMGLVDWRLSSEAAEVPGLADALIERAHRFEIDIDGSGVTQRFLTQEQDLFGDAPPMAEWTPELLANLLAPMVRDSAVAHADLLGWLSRVVARLLESGQAVPQLMRMKHVVARRLKLRVAELQAAARQKEARRWLFDVGAPVETLASEGFVFRNGMYDGVKPYRGRKVFNKHFLPFVPAFDGADGDGEEADCAFALDSLQKVDVWSRNVAGHPASFWLQTSKDRTYPDFVARLTDGRIFVVEYKGDHLWDGAAEDRAIGLAWERAGGGLYLMVRKSDQGRSPLTQLMDKLDAA